MWNRAGLSDLEGAKLMFAFFTPLTRSRKQDKKTKGAVI